MNKLSRFLIILSPLIFVIIIIHFNFFSLKDNIYEKFPNLQIRKYIFSNEPILQKINNDYNVKFLPKTEYFKFELEKKKITFNPKYYLGNKTKKNISYGKYGTFFIDKNNSYIFITDFLGNIYFADLEAITDNSKELQVSQIKNNLNEIERVYDVLVDDNEIFISFVKEIESCRKIYVSSSNINLKNLNFKNIFISETCNKDASPGRMQILNKNDNKGLIMSISSGAYNSPSDESQNENSIYGKIIFVNPVSKKYSIFSKGHRVVQGLTVNNEIIIATEHGPRGGDEINIIKEKKNYGWPIASYGERYDFDYNNKPYFKKNHEDYGFEEPIFSFIPAIGISEIIKLPETFSEMVENVYVVSSLYGKSIFFVKFDKKFNKVIFSEKIFLAERIRDLKYLKEKNLIILAFEENGELGILKKTN